MSKVLVEELSLEHIADAIREQNGEETQYKPAEMANAILDLSVYPEPTGTKSITANGTGIDVKDYASADVNVPNSYSQSDEGKVVSEGALVAQGSQTITQNGTYDTTLIDEAIINVSGGGGGTIEPLSVTQNGTYTPPSGVDGYAPVTVNVSGGGSGADFEIDFTSVGTKTVDGVDYSSVGATYNATTDRMIIGDAPTIIADDNGITIEVDVASMSLASGNHRRFLMASDSNGFIYRSTGVWAFYSGTWEDGAFADATDGSLFDDCTVKLYIDSSNKWHIYKDDVLVFEPAKAQSISNFMIGSSSNSINNAVITALRIYKGQH